MAVSLWTLPECDANSAMYSNNAYRTPRRKHSAVFKNPPAAFFLKAEQSVTCTLRTVHVWGTSHPRMHPVPMVKLNHLQMHWVWVCLEGQGTSCE